MKATPRWRERFNPPGANVLFGRSVPHEIRCADPPSVSVPKRIGAEHASTRRGDFMPNKLSFTVVAAAGMLLYAGNLVQAQTIASGTRVDVRTDETIDVRDQVDGRVFTGSVANDVMDQSGRVVIPRGSRAELEVRRIGSNEMSVDLDSVTVGQERYSVQATAPRTSREGVGENKRTGEYVGGGALLGTVLGAIAGGGKGPGEFSKLAPRASTEEPSRRKPRFAARWARFCFYVRPL